MVSSVSWREWGPGGGWEEQIRGCRGSESPDHGGGMDKIYVRSGLGEICGGNGDLTGPFRGAAGVECSRQGAKAG